jgi:ribosome-binding factor A
MPQSNVNPRKLRLAEAILHIVQSAIIFEVEHKDIHKTTFINRVEISDDKKYAKIFAVPESSDTVAIEKEIDALNKISGFFRKKIASEVKVRIVPELKFVFDAGYIKAESVLKTLNNLNNEDNSK